MANFNDFVIKNEKVMKILGTVQESKGAWKKPQIRFSVPNVDQNGNVLDTINPFGYIRCNGRMPGETLRGTYKVLLIESTNKDGETIHHWSLGDMISDHVEELHQANLAANEARIAALNAAATGKVQFSIG